MHFYYFFLLLLVVLSVYSESPQHAKAPDSFNSTVVTVCPNSSSTSLGILAPVLPQNEVFEIALPQNGVFEIVLSQIETDKTVLHQSNIVTVNCQWLNSMKIALNFMSNIGDKITKNLTSAVTHGAEKLAWTIRILLECLQHILKMYAWSLSENQASVQFKCRLIALMLKQSLFRKHDFSVWVYYESLIY